MYSLWSAIRSFTVAVAGAVHGTATVTGSAIITAMGGAIPGGSSGITIYDRTGTIPINIYDRTGTVLVDIFDRLGGGSTEVHGAGVVAGNARAVAFPKVGGTSENGYASWSAVWSFTVAP